MDTLPFLIQETNESRMDGMQRPSTQATSWAPPSFACMPPIGDESLLIAQNNLELIRQNAELRAHIALINENASLAQMKERLEKKLRASKTVSRVVQRKTR